MVVQQKNAHSISERESLIGCEFYCPIKRLELSSTKFIFRPKMFCTAPTSFLVPRILINIMYKNIMEINFMFEKSVSTKCRLQTADCRLQTGYKMQTRYKMQTADCRLSTKCRLTRKTFVYVRNVSTFDFITYLPHNKLFTHAKTFHRVIPGRN